MIGVQAFLVREYKGGGTALIGNLSMALGFTLLLFQGTFSDFLTIIVANSLLILSPNLYHIAISLFTGKKPNQIFIVSVLTANALLVGYFRYVVDNVNVRIVVVSLAGVLSTILITKQLWNARHAPYRISIALASIPFVVYGLFLSARAISAIISPPDALFANTPIESATYFLLFIISFLWTTGFILMISQRLQSDLTVLATTDVLTSLPNRRATQHFFERELSRIKRYGGEFSIILIDLDKFKRVNDTYGHAMGDFVLINTAQIFQSAIRKQDIAGRWGGEEFLFILPSTPLQNAYMLAERIRKELDNTEFKDENVGLKITMSGGVAHSDGAETIDDILKKADDALYAAKVTRNAMKIAK